MLKHYVPLLPDPSEYSTYCEPFFGGGAMFAYLKSSNPTLKCYINDINPDIIHIFLSIQNNYKKFTNILDDLEKQYIPLSKAKRKIFYYKIRDIHAWDYKSWDKIEESAHLYFLMRTSFNGILQINQNTNNRFGTPAGLLNEVDHIYDKNNIKLWKSMLENCVITSGDWKKCVSQKMYNTFFFFDPPYRGCFTSYGQTFTDEDQIRLLNFSKNADAAGHKVMLCNRDGDKFWNNKQGHLQVAKFNVTYTAGRRKRVGNGFEAKAATEILFYSRKGLEGFMS